MKNNRVAFKSHRKKVVKKSDKDIVSIGIRHGETLIPIGAGNAVIHLPATKDTFTYDIINTADLTNDLTVATTEGNLKGLILNTSAAGELSIDPVGAGTKQLQFASTIEDGSFISTLSDGADWFIWSFGIGAGLGQSTTQRPTTASPSTGLTGNSTGGLFQSNTSNPSYSPVVIDTVNVTVDYPSGPAENDLSFTGSAHPSTPTALVTLKVFDSVPAQVGTVNVASDGSWTFSVNDLDNGQHEYRFEAFIGGSSINESNSWNDVLNGGALQFDCSEIQIEVGTSGPDFTTFPTVQHVDENGVTTPVSVSVNSTTYSDSLTEDQTFNVVFDFTYDSVTYQRTVQGVVVNLVQPAVPAVSTVGGNTSGVAINATTANIVGTAEPNATVEVWIDGIPNQAIGTVTANGTGDWTISSHDFGFISNSTVIVKAQQQTVGGSLWSNASTDFFVVYEQNVLTPPTVTVDTFASGDFTNQLNPFAISGTGVDGSEITLNGATPLSTPVTVAGGTWSTTINLSHDATHNITAQATKAGFVNSQQSTAFELNVDRTDPTLTPVTDTTLYLGGVTDTLPTATDSFSTVSVGASYSPTLAEAEGVYVATYTATDAAGNTASNSRNITVTTQVAVPVITSITDNGDGTATVAGTVPSSNAANLNIQLLVGGVNNGSAVSLSGDSFSLTATGLSTGTFSFTAKTINSVSDESDESTAVSQAIVVAVIGNAPTLRVIAGNNADGLEHSTGATAFGTAAYDIDEAAFIFDNPTNAISDGTDYINVPYSSDFDRPSSGDLTVQLWFNADRLPVGEGGGGRNFGLISRTDAGNTPDGGWLLAITTESGFSSGGIQATIFPVPHNRTLPPGGVSTGVWHHVALVIRNSGTATVYYDGQELSTYTYNTNSEAGALSKNYPLIIGGFSFNEGGTTIDQHFDGKIKGAAIDQREVPASEILDNYNNPPAEVSDGATVSTDNGSAFSFKAFGDDVEDGTLVVGAATETPTFDVDTNNTYEIEHSVTDSDGNTTTHTFDVTVS